jgi:hypothetical protein
LKEELGVDAREHQAAIKDATVILITRIRWLVQNKKDFIFPGTNNNLLIQGLGDAYGIFKKSKAHGHPS